MTITFYLKDGTIYSLENVDSYEAGEKFFITHCFNKKGESVFHGTLIEDIKDYQVK